MPALKYACCLTYLAVYDVEHWMQKLLIYFLCYIIYTNCIYLHYLHTHSFFTDLCIIVCALKGIVQPFELGSETRLIQSAVK
jgi:hypothetical protein